MRFILVDSLLGYKLVWREIRRVLESKYSLIPHYELLDIYLDWFKLRGQLVYNGLKKEANATKYVQGLLCFLKAFGGVVIHCLILLYLPFRGLKSEALLKELACARASHLPASQFCLLKMQLF